MFGSVFCGVWHSTHIFMPRREPPCADNWSWQALQLAVSMMS